jgi:cell division transport system permease protein
MSRRTVRRRGRAWGRRQLYSLFSSIGTLFSHKLATLMTVLVLGIAMSLPLGLFVVVENLRTVDFKQGEWGSITVFLTAEAGETQAGSLARDAESAGSVAVRLISPDDGMAEFAATSGFSAAAELFEENPLPWVAVFSPTSDNPVEIDAWVKRWEAWLGEREGIDLVQVDYKWLQRLAGLLALGNALITVLTVMFSLAVIVVVANTIRLDVANRADEIEVMSLVGANNSFIRQPFLYSGLWYGLLGAVLALIFLLAALWYLQSPLERLLDAYGNQYVLHGLAFTHGAAVLLLGGVLGFSGAWLSVQRHLRNLSHGRGIRR